MLMDNFVFLVDLDGTLLNSGGEVCQRAVEAISQARLLGAKFVIATGRNWEESRGAIQATGLMGPIIVASGAMSVIGETGQLISATYIKKEDVVMLGKIFQDEGHRVLLLKSIQENCPEYVAVGSAPLNQATSWWFDKYQTKLVKVKSFMEDPFLDYTIRIGIVGKYEKLLPLVEKIKDIKKDLTVHCWSAVTSSQATGSETSILEIFGPSVNKWESFQNLNLHGYVNGNYIIAIGDGDNDIEMITRSSLGIAMENAAPHVKKFADEVSDHHDNQGVAKVISNQIFLARSLPRRVS